MKLLNLTILPRLSSVVWVQNEQR